MLLDFLVKTFKKFKIHTSSHEPRPQCRRKYQFQMVSASSLFETLEFEFESTDQFNLFQFHDFCFRFTLQQAISRKNYINKARTPAVPLSDNKCWCAFAEFSQNIYRNDLLRKYRNLSSFNHFHQSKHITTISKKNCLKKNIRSVSTC